MCDDRIPLSPSLSFANPPSTRAAPPIARSPLQIKYECERYGKVLAVERDARARCALVEFKRCGAPREGFREGVVRWASNRRAALCALLTAMRGCLSPAPLPPAAPHPLLPRHMRRRAPHWPLAPAVGRSRPRQRSVSQPPRCPAHQPAPRR